ncbi:MAG: alpha/beta hydrolase [Planctomycetes bacterium]|nr:alpha/beta hydrolase [Planctomycetota bacterium]
MIAASQKRTFSKMHSHTISLPGQTLTALSANESAAGPPVVFIHGITASGNLWLPSMPAEIRDGRRWISLSLPGHYPAKIDRSTIESWDVVTSEIWASWYQTALQQLIGDEPTDFVGWSTGGFTSLAMGVHFPKRVRSILSISGFAIGEWLGLIGRFQRMSLSALTRWMVRLGFGSVGGQRWLFDLVIGSGVGDFKAFRSSPVYEESMRDWFATFGQHDSVIMAELFRKISRVDLSDCIGRIGCPTLIAGGDSDPYIPASHTRWIADQVRGAELVLWPGAGHMFFAERTQEYQDLLVRWLNRS